MTTEDTRQAARAYFDAWTTNKGPEVMRPLMDEDFVFTTAGHTVEGRDAFLAAGGWPEGADVRMLAEAYEGEHGFQLYEGSKAGQTVRIVEHLTVRNDRIAASEVVTDMQAFMAFVGGP